MIRIRMSRGQMTIVNLIYVVVLLAVLGGLLPIYYNLTNNLLTSVTDPVVRFMIQLIPFAIVGGVLATIVAMSRPGGYYS